MGCLRLLAGLGAMGGVATGEVSLEKSRQSTTILASFYPLALEQDYDPSRRQLRRRA